jgi:putative ABC transport system substrate-binding protein
MTSRRTFVLTLSAALLVPAAARAQTRAVVRRVGFLALGNQPSSWNGTPFEAFLQGMRELGYVEGKNLTMEWRFAGGSAERMQAMAAELVQRQVDLIVTYGVPPTAAAQRATTTIPIVMGTATDPLRTGLVKSLAHPGGNITGLSNSAVDVAPKHLQLLLDITPQVKRVALLLNADTASHRALLENVASAAQRAKISLVPAEVRTPEDLETAFAQFTRDKAAALILPLAPLFIDQRAWIAQRALKNGWPSISGVNGYAEAGGLMSYGQNLVEHCFRAATPLRRHPPLLRQLPVAHRRRPGSVKTRGTERSSCSRRRRSCQRQATSSGGAAHSRTITRIGVGLNPLHGFRVCGQFEITASTSISARRST